MNNRIKCDVTMLQSNTASHLMAFMLTQRDLLIDLLTIIEKHEDVADDIVKQCIDQELGKKISFKPVKKIEDSNSMKRSIKEVREDFEYIIKLHTHALHQRTSNKLYKKDKCEYCDENIDRWAT